MHIEHNHDHPPATESWTGLFWFVANRYAELAMFCARNLGLL